MKRCGRTVGWGEELTLSSHLPAEFVFPTPLRMQGFSLSAKDTSPHGKLAICRPVRQLTGAGEETAPQAQGHLAYGGLTISCSFVPHLTKGNHSLGVIPKKFRVFVSGA